MQPKKFDNMMFIDYEQKARYMVEHFDISESLNEFFKNIDNIANKKVKVSIPAKSYINKLLYLKSVDYKEFLSDLENQNSYKTKFSKIILKQLFSNRTQKFCDALNEKYDVDYDSLIIDYDDDKVTTNINDETIELDDFEGCIFCTYHKTLLTNEKFINIIIDCIGDIIERKSGKIDGLTNTRI